MSEQIISMSDAAELLGVTKRTLWLWDKNGELKIRRIGGKRYYYRSDIDKALTVEG